MDNKDKNIDFQDDELQESEKVQVELEMLDIDKLDPDFEEISQDVEQDGSINSYGSITTSDYDELAPLESDEVENETSSQEQSIHINYSFKGEDVVEGLTTMQALLQFKKNMIYTGILLVIFFVYMLDFANIQSLILGGLCLVVIGVIWIMPKIHIKRFVKAADENKVNFSIDIYSNHISVVNSASNQQPVKLAFNKQINNIIETDNLFVICSGKERVFILPKRCINENLHEFVREIFQIAMGDNFYQKNIVI